MAHLNFIQTRSGLSCNYALHTDGYGEYAVATPFKKLKFVTEFYCNGYKKYELRFNMNDCMTVMSSGKGKTRSVPLCIKDADGNAIGNIYVAYSRLFIGYRYFVLNLYGREYLCYEVGLGKEGIKLPIYCGETQVALVEKDNVVYNNMDKYDIYLNQPELIEPAMFFCLYYDITRSGNNDEVAYKSKQVSYVFTRNKELLSKYDPQFLSRIGH